MTSARRIATLSLLTLASPAYIERLERPDSPDELEGHGVSKGVGGSAVPRRFALGICIITPDLGLLLGGKAMSNGRNPAP